jgi:transaldolase
VRELIADGVNVNVTLLFSREQYVAAADAFLRGIERRIEAGLKPVVASVASLFVSRWDAAVAGKVTASLQNHLGIAIAKRTYKAYRGLLASSRWQRAFNSGARPQRLLWASTGTKDPKASDVLYVKALAAPFTVNTMPENTLKALADHGQLDTILPADGGDRATDQECRRTFCRGQDRRAVTRGGGCRAGANAGARVRGIPGAIHRCGPAVPPRGRCVSAGRRRVALPGRPTASL